MKTINSILKIIFTITLCTVSTSCLAQNLLSDLNDGETAHAINQAQDLGRKKEKENKKIQDFFLKDLPWKRTEDSTMIIGFSFKINVEENTRGLIKPISIIANDSLAYKLFPKYERLKNIDYTLFLKGRKEGIFIIPVLMEIVGSQPAESYTNEKLLDFMNKRVFFTTIKHDPGALFHLNYEEGKLETENYIYFEPVIIGVDKRINN
jgi:hypothetical protein